MCLIETVILLTFILQAFLLAKYVNELGLMNQVLLLVTFFVLMWSPTIVNYFSARLVKYSFAFLKQVMPTNILGVMWQPQALYALYVSLSAALSCDALLKIYVLFSHN